LTIPVYNYGHTPILWDYTTTNAPTTATTRKTLMRARLSPLDLDTWIVGDVGLEPCVKAEAEVFVTGTTTWTVKEGVSEQAVEYVATAPSSESPEKMAVRT
jgi:hypothetical protein